MAIKVKCKCGQVLSVPDDKAGKSGKCPKCGELIRIPAATEGSAAPSKGTASKGAPAKVPSQSAAKGASSASASSKPRPNALDDLFKEEGIEVRRGNFCPQCDSPFPTGAVFCVSCGYHFSSGVKVAQHESMTLQKEFDNPHLNEAAEMMVREKAQESRVANAGTPWWVMLCILISGLSVVGAGVLIVEARQGDPRPTTTLIGKLQAYPVGWTALGLLCLNCTIISVFAHMATTAFAYKRARKQGLLCTFVPGYSAFFGLMNFRAIRGTVVSYWLAILIGIPAIIYMAVSAPDFNNPPPRPTLQIILGPRNGAENEAFGVSVAQRTSTVSTGV